MIPCNLLNQLSEPDVAADAAKFQKLMKEQAELQPIADAYKDYKTQKQTIEESLMLLEEESDEEMREMLKEELSDAKKRVEELLNQQPGNMPLQSHILVLFLQHSKNLPQLH